MARKRKNLLEGTRWDPLLSLLSERRGSRRVRSNRITAPIWAMIRRGDQRT
jgi:hypothetical protein